MSHSSQILTKYHRSLPTLERAGNGTLKKSQRPESLIRQVVAILSFHCRFLLDILEILMDIRWFSVFLEGNDPDRSQ